MKIKKLKDTKSQRDFWDLVESTAKEVRGYPRWKRIRQNDYHKFYYYDEEDK